MQWQSAVLGLILLATSVVPLHNNHELLTGRDVAPSQIARMRRLVARQPGVVALPDLFAIVVGRPSLIVDADVIVEDGLGSPAGMFTNRRVTALLGAIARRWSCR
jgi:hypothetical protein